MSKKNGYGDGIGKADGRTGARPARAAILTIVATAVFVSTFGRAEALPPRPTFQPPEGLRATPVAVFGRDDRIRSPKERAEIAEKVGVLIDLDRNTVCTAFCVGPDTVMTAGHCVYPTAGPGGARLDAIRYRQTLQTTTNDARIAGPGGRAAASSTLVGAKRLSLRPPIDAVSDWMLIRLDRNVCPKGGLPLSRRSTEDVLALARDMRVYNIAFHRDFEDFARAVSAPCDAPRTFDGATWETISRDFRNAGGVILHTCDTGGSSSGSPLLFDGPDGPEVVGINVGTYLHSTVVTPARERQSASALPSTSREIANTAIAAHTVVDAVSAFMSAELVATIAGRRRLQIRLAAAGDYSGPVDGKVSPNFTEAIRKAERRVGLPVTGLPTWKLLRRLD